MRKVGFFCVFSVILSIILLPSRKAYAADMTDIRVGLEALYKNKSTIMIYNSEIALGFCIGNAYEQEIELYSAAGFGFNPDKGTYYVSRNNYASYNEAVSVCNEIAAGGAVAYPAYAGRNSWKVYVTAASYNAFSTGKMKAYSSDYVKQVSSAYLIKVTGQDLVLLIDGERAGGFPQIKALKKTDGILSVNLGSRSYRGRIEIGRYGGASTVTAVNIINIESYLLGVITCEMNHTWPEEALKAQAVCSRSFAYMRSRFGADSNLKTAYSMGDTTASQVYKGVTGETTEGTDAVKATIGQIVLSKGKPIDAFFFSTSGGATDSIMDIWGISSSSYAGVFDVFETDPEKKPWVVDFSVNEASERLSSAGYNVGKVISIEPEILTESGRIYRARIKGTSKTLTITGSKLKSIFGLSDTKCRVITSNSTADTVTVIGADDTKRIRLMECYAISDNGTEKLSGNVSQYIVISSDNYYNIPRVLPDEGILRFIGMGWGHGVGMSQSGAKGMAEKGYDYRQIIAYYYNNAEVGGY